MWPCGNHNVALKIGGDDYSDKVHKSLMTCQKELVLKATAEAIWRVLMTVVLGNSAQLFCCVRWGGLLFGR